MKKEKILFLIFALILMNFASAINLDINILPVSNSVVSDLEKPAVFDLVIHNKGESGVFEIYSLVGVDISPENFSMSNNEEKKITILVMPQKSLQNKKGFLTFEYLIKDSNKTSQKGTLTINIVDLESSFDILPGNINPNPEKVSVLIKNKISKDFPKINIQLTSVFFYYNSTLSLNAFESKEIEIEIDKTKIKELNAGSYLVNSFIEAEGKKIQKEAVIRFLEQEDVYSDESFSGIIKRQEEIIRHNVGNVKKEVVIRAERNLISSLFTSFNIRPSDSGFSGFNRYYVWKKEIVPNEELKIIILTNWFYLVFILLIVGGLFYFNKRFFANDLILSKKVSFVKTKGGQFALKIMLIVKSKSFIERINVVDKLPHLVELYEKFGVVAPNDIDLKNKRLEWEIESLNAGEERVFSYIIYSKIGVLGRFELPSAKAIYEKQGKIKEVSSNRCFYINEGKD